MVKLPKEMQSKVKSKPKRPQPSVKRDGQQFGSRQMRRRMGQQGIDMEPIDATRVIIEGPEKTMVIDQPEVFLMKQAGQEIYQVIGQTENDIMLGAAQANVDKKDAESVLKECNGDIAKAILFLKNRL